MDSSCSLYGPSHTYLKSALVVVFVYYISKQHSIQLPIPTLLYTNINIYAQEAHKKLLFYTNNKHEALHIYSCSLRGPRQRTSESCLFFTWSWTTTN